MVAVPSPETLDRLAAALETLERAEPDGGTLRITARVSLRLSHLRKVYFPDAGITKGDLLRYYVRVAPVLLPLLADRPLALRRFPDGVAGEPFFQQKAPADPPAGVRVATVDAADGEAQERLVGGTLATLVYCVQLGAFECNPWHARLGRLANPDYLVIDLDPGERAPFARVVETALWVREELERRDLAGLVKTSGATGMHVYAPLPSGTGEQDVAGLAESVARAAVARHPRETTVERSISARGPRAIYVDHGQNARGKTVAAAYSVRAHRGATVSTPLRWDEVVPGELDPAAFTLRTVPERIARVGDLWGPALRLRRSRRRPVPDP